MLRNSEQVSGFTVYVNFRNDATITIYQQLEASYFQSFNSIWKTDGKMLTGTYNDSVPWGSDYEYEMSSDGERLTLRSAGDSPEVSVYRRCSIPEDVINASHPEVKSY